MSKLSCKTKLLFHDNKIDYKNKRKTSGSSNVESVIVNVYGNDFIADNLISGLQTRSEETGAVWKNSTLCRLSHVVAAVMWHDVRGCWCYAPLQDKAGYYRTTCLSHPSRTLASGAVNHRSETAHLVSARPACFSSISAADRCCWKLACSVYPFTSTTRKKAPLSKQTCRRSGENIPACRTRFMNHYQQWWMTSLG